MTAGGDGHVPQSPPTRSPAPVSIDMESAASAQIHKFSYRKSFPQDRLPPLQETEPLDDQRSPVEASSPGRPPAGEGEQRSRESTPHARRPSSSRSMGASYPLRQKKRQSILSGFFHAKEPTQTALNQVAAQLVAQHGSASASKVPNVSMEKIPDFVPKPNSKWDGIPESIKIRERQEKERRKGAKRLSSSQSGTTGTRSLDSRGGTVLGSSWKSSSTNASLESRSRSSGSQTSPSQPTRFYAASVNSSGDLASQQRGDHPRWSAPRQSPSFSPSSLPDHPRTAALFSNDIASSPAIPQRSSSTGRTRFDRARLETLKPIPDNPVVPESPVSLTAAARDGPPVTPSPLTHARQGSRLKSAEAEAEEERGLRSSGPIVLAPPITTKRKAREKVNSAFLAGEAHPVELPEDDSGDEEIQPPKNLPLRAWERAGRIPTSSAAASAVTLVQQDLVKRPDTSRARLGLGANMFVRTNETPWGTSDGGKGMGSSLKMMNGTPASPRGKLPKALSFFGKDKS